MSIKFSKLETMLPPRSPAKPQKSRVPGKKSLTPALPVEGNRPGARLRKLRKNRGMTLADLAERTGFSTSALSKMETERLGLTYDKLTRLCEALGVEVGSLFVDRPQLPPGAVGRRSISRHNEGRNLNTGRYDYLYISPELSNKRIVPILGRVQARSMEEFGPLIRHEGEEWIYVLKGKLEVHCEFYEPVTLEEGDSIYLDSRMGHAYLSKTRGGTQIIAVCTEPQSDRTTPTTAKREAKRRRSR